MQQLLLRNGSVIDGVKAPLTPGPGGRDIVIQVTWYVSRLPLEGDV